MYSYYLELLSQDNYPDFLNRYLGLSSVARLKDVGYFCGMDYASKNIYNFSEYISRFDHSLSTALLTWKLTLSKDATVAALFHDIATPCFSHVIDYMNLDFEKQETTERNNDKFLFNDRLLQSFLDEDNISLYNLINFKNYTVIDLPRPMLCADRIDGIILTSSIWTKQLDINMLPIILSGLTIYQNEYNQDEIGFNSLDVANYIIEQESIINDYCHSKEDTYMMLLLAKIVRTALKSNIINSDDLYNLGEKDLLYKMTNSKDFNLNSDLELFYSIRKKQIPEIEIPKIKKRIISPMVNGKRIKTSSN